MRSEPQAKRMPTFLRIVMYGAAVMGTIGLLMSILLLGATLYFPGPYSVNARMVSYDEFMALAVPGIGAYLVMSVLTLRLSWGLRHERTWVRPLFLAIATSAVAAPTLMAYVSGVDLRAGMASLIICAGMLVVLWWQLYHDDDIVAYYAAIQDEQRR
jgi:hypothetical protein